MASNCKTDPLGDADQALIAVNGVSKIYCDGDVRALDDLSLEIAAGEFVAITGPSGCGKSTLLNLIGALDRPTSGEVLFRGHPLSERKDLDQFRAREIGFVFQAYYLLPNLTSEENVQIPMFQTERDREKRQSRSRELLSSVGLGDRTRHFPRQLSIGQRQRVAIARAIANEPSVILADEPTGALDSTSGSEVLDLLESLNRDRQTTLVIVTHDNTVAQRAGRVIQMRDGKLV
jgi:ABC-type lipoprotein export system ATPase subunit